MNDRVPSPLRDSRERLFWRILATGFCLVGGHSLFLLFGWFPEQVQPGQLDLHILCGLCLILPLLGYLIRHLSRLGAWFRGKVRVTGLLTAVAGCVLVLTGLCCIWIRSGAVAAWLSWVHAGTGFVCVALFVTHRRLGPPSSD